MNGGNFPPEIGSWSADDVKRLCEEYPIETDWLVFETELTESTALNAAALANTSGGYVVFGVSKDAEIIGIAPDIAFAKTLAKMLAAVDPNIIYTLQSKLEIEDSKNLLYIMMVPRSPTGLHMVDNIFYKRNGGVCVPMQSTEVYRGVLSTEERRRKYKTFKEKFGGLTLELESVQNDLRHYEINLVKEAEELNLLLLDITPLLSEEMAERLEFDLTIIQDTVQLLRLEKSKSDFIALRLLSRFLSRELIPELIEIADELEIDLETERTRRAIATWQTRISTVKS